PFDGSNTEPKRFVRVSLAGGSNNGLVLDNRTLIFECWGTSKPDAARLCEQAYSVIMAAKRDPAAYMFIRDVAVFGGPTYFPDPNTPNPRYQFTVSLTVRGTVVH